MIFLIFSLFTIYFYLRFMGPLVSWAPKFRAPCRGTISTCHNHSLIVSRPTFESLSLAIFISNYNSVNNKFLSFGGPSKSGALRSEEHTSELQSPYDLVC